MTSTLLLIAAAALALGFSLVKDKVKTGKSLQMARHLFTGVATDITGILALIGLFLAVVPTSSIKAVLGGPSTLLSGLYGAVIGTITILPAFVAFPLAASLVAKGAHLMAIAAFITTLTMVGFATLPIEIKHFGTRFALVRNALSFLAALVIAVGVVVFL